MDYTGSVSRALTSGAVWFAVAYGLGMVVGADLPASSVAYDAGIMAGSSIGADVVHSALGWQPTGITSAVATGATYAGLQYALRGDTNFAVNGGAAALNDMLVEQWYKMGSA